MSTLRIYRRHLYGEEPPCTRTRYCANGARAFFARHGLDWSDFLRNGIDGAAFTATGDAMALKAVEHAREESSRGR